MENEYPKLTENLVAVMAFAADKGITLERVTVLQDLLGAPLETPPKKWLGVEINPLTIS